MAPSTANGKLPQQQQQHRVYVVERRAELRQIGEPPPPPQQQQPPPPCEPEVSHLDFAYLDEKQAYAAAIREQILELDEGGGGEARQVAAQTGLPLKERLKAIHKLADGVKFDVLEFPLAPVAAYPEGELLKVLGEEGEESEDIEDEEEASEEEEVELGEEDEEGEEGVEEEEVEEEEEEDEAAEDDLEESLDEGEEVDDDEDEDDSDAGPQPKKQRK